MATGKPSFTVSSRRKLRPSSGVKPNVASGSPQTSAVNTRSGRSPPEIVRFPRSKAATRSSDATLSRTSRYSYGESASMKPRSLETFGYVTPTAMRRSASGYGNGLRTTPSRRLYTSVFAPMPSPNDAITVAANTLLRVSVRAA
jgi:hypothetical protein